MIIEDEVKVRKRVYRKNERIYTMYYITFSIRYSEFLSKIKELYNVEIVTPKFRIVIPKVNLFQYSYHLVKKTSVKIPQFSIVIPKSIGEELENKGIKKVKVIVEVPDLVVES